MRARDLRELSNEELDKKLAESRENLFNLRFQDATGALENTARLKLAKRACQRSCFASTRACSSSVSESARTLSISINWPPWRLHA